jgi:hypothetical protein
MSEVKLNKGQQIVVDTIKEKIDNGESGFITISGGAGVGKTFSVKYALEDVLDSNFLAITPSHKACSVLTESIGKNAVTLASALGIRLNEFNGTFKPDPEAEKAIKGKRYILIDEVSMVSGELLKVIEREKEPSALIVMMGDINQLPPVGSDKPSPAFTDYPVLYLTEVMRQKKDSDMVPFLQNVVGAIEERNDFSMDKINVKGSDMSYCFQLESFISSFCTDSRKDKKGTRMMTYNNEKSMNPLGVKMLNLEICKKLHNGFEFEKGFQLMAYNGFVHKPKTKRDPNQGFRIVNSVDYTVEKVGEKRLSTRDIKAYIKDPRDGKKGLKTTPISIEVQKITLSSNCEDYVFSCEIPTLSDKGVGKLQDLIQTSFAVKEFQFGYKLMETFPYMLPGYVVSSHKSQGSTYSNSYVVYENIISQKNVKYKDKLKAIYVAASRASKKIVIL